MYIIIITINALSCIVYIPATVTREEWSNLRNICNYFNISEATIPRGFLYIPATETREVWLNLCNIYIISIFQRSTMPREFLRCLLEKE